MVHHSNTLAQQGIGGRGYKRLRVMQPSGHHQLENEWGRRSVCHAQTRSYARPHTFCVWQESAPLR